MRVTIPYGTTELSASMPWARILDTLTTAEVPALAAPSQALLEGLKRPIDAPSLASSLRPDGSVLILVSDSFRKTGIHHLLPALLEFLNHHKIPDWAISFLFATGTHRGPTEEEQAEILGPEIQARFQERIFVHDPHNEAHLVNCGVTTRGTPIFINHLAVEANTVIATGTVVLHYFGGFGGGRKSIVPGIAGVRTIAANHALNLDPVEDRLNPHVAIGKMDGNPVAEDMLEGAKRCENVFLINTVLNRRGEIARVFCGDLELAHRAACAFARDVFTVPIQEKADFVVASAGAAKNFVQSHKSLYNACQAVRPGGAILLATPASEGYGGSRFATWLQLGSATAIIAELRKNAEINGQTALSTVEKAPSAVIISEMSQADIEALGAKKAHSLADGLDRVRRTLAKEGIHQPTCYIMPDAPFSVPIFVSPPKA